MSTNKQSLVPNAREALNKFKMEAANEVGVNLKQGYNGDLTSKQAGSVGGQMVKKMIEAYENGISNCRLSDWMRKASPRCPLWAAGGRLLFPRKIKKN